MKPIGPLMWEHRLIEQMVPLMKKEIEQIGKNHIANVYFISIAVDFFRTYADRTHHGKEEDILFRELSKKQLAKEHQKIMDELVEEHRLARETVKRLVDARDRYLKGQGFNLEIIKKTMTELADLYPEHIRKEDKAFFFPVMEYFTESEQKDILRRFSDFDRQMIHEKYQGIISDLGGKVLKRPPLKGE